MHLPLNLRLHAVRLAFDAGACRVHENLSGAAAWGDWLWVAGDEGCEISVLRREPAPQRPARGAPALRYAESHVHALADLLDLPGAADGEADIEGLCACDGWLWLVGSHSLKRRAVDLPDTPGEAVDHALNARRLAEVRLDANRLLLARVPIELDAEGVPRLVRKAADGRRAGALKAGEKRSTLTKLLRDDPHVGRFMAIPGKDNGFDIEGLAVDGERVLVGLRGPVLRGWSTVLELCVQARADGALHLARRGGKNGPRLVKHFVQLDGLGVRDLLWRGDDLYLLAGPTMVLDGEIRLYRWAGARAALAANGERVRFEPRQALAAVAELPHGRGCDRAEAVCMLDAGGREALLVLYDAPGPQRRQGSAVTGDLLELGAPEG